MVTPTPPYLEDVDGLLRVLRLRSEFFHEELLSRADRIVHKLPRVGFALAALGIDASLQAGVCFDRREVAYLGAKQRPRLR